VVGSVRASVPDRHFVSSTIFAIDTAAERCTLALARGDRVEHQEGEPGRTHLEHVMPAVTVFFTGCAVRPAQCDAFAFASGPGSFTGLRIACTVVQGLALAVGRPVIAVGNLHALAVAAHLRRGGEARRILAVIDARMQQAYWAVFDARPESWVEVVPSSLCDTRDLPSIMEEWQPDLCAGEARWLHQILAGREGEIVDARVDATVVAAIAREKFARGEVLRAQDVSPAYTRDRVALTVAQRRDAREGRAP